MRKWGVALTGMPGTKGVQRVGAEEQHAEYMALKAKLLYWLHKDSHSKSVEKARQNDFLLRLEVLHASLSGPPCLNIPLSQAVHFRFVGSWRNVRFSCQSLINTQVT